MAVEPNGLSIRQADKLVKAVGQAALEVEGLEAEMDRELQDVRGRYDVRLATLRARRKRLEEELVAGCRANRETLFEAGSQTLSLGFGRIGYRAGSLSLVFQEGITEEEVLKRLTPRLHRFMRVSQSLDKTGLKAAAAAGDVRPGEVDRMGLRLIQGDEVWTVKPNHEAIKGEVGTV